MPTGSPAVKATTLTSAPGISKSRRAAAGFTLLELMIVLVIVAVSAGLVSLALRDRSQSHLETEGARLSALLETARTQSRIIGTDVSWKPVDTGGFEFDGLPPAAAKELPKRWLDSDTKATIVAWLLGHGVDLDEEALSHLNKAELLDLVDELTNEDD